MLSIFGVTVVVNMSRKYRGRLRARLSYYLSARFIITRGVSQRVINWPRRIPCILLGSTLNAFRACATKTMAEILLETSSLENSDLFVTLLYCLRLFCYIFTLYGHKRDNKW